MCERKGIRRGIKSRQNYVTTSRLVAQIKIYIGNRRIASCRRDSTARRRNLGISQDPALASVAGLTSSDVRFCRSRSILAAVSHSRISRSYLSAILSISLSASPSVIPRYLTELSTRLCPLLTRPACALPYCFRLSLACRLCRNRRSRCRQARNRNC